MGIVPFTDAIYQSCSTRRRPRGITVGGVDYPYRIGQLEVTVKQWVTFLNTVDPDRQRQHGLYKQTESSAGWPKYGQINHSSSAPSGMHYSVAYPEWNDKPYSFANFLQCRPVRERASNGRLLSKRRAARTVSTTSPTGAALAGQTDAGCTTWPGRTPRREPRLAGFVVPSQNEWIKAAYYDPSGGGTYSYWKYPTNAGVFGDGTATAPSTTTLDPAPATSLTPRRSRSPTYHAVGRRRPHLVPGGGVSPSTAPASNPFGIDPTTYAQLYQGSLGTVGQARPRHRGARSTRAATPSSGPTRSPPRRRGTRSAGLAPPARRHRQRARLPAVALGGRPPAAGQRVLRLHLSVARVPGRRGREPERRSGAETQRRFARASRSTWPGCCPDRGLVHRPNGELCFPGSTLNFSGQSQDLNFAPSSEHSNFAPARRT